MAPVSFEGRLVGSDVNVLLQSPENVRGLIENLLVSALFFVRIYSFKLYHNTFFLPLDDKRIDFDTFLPYLGEAMKFRDPFDNYEAFQECLKCYDKDGIGVIDSAAFRHGLSYLGKNY